MQTVLKDIKTDRVRAYFVWLPVIRTDDREWAVRRSKEFQDPRVTHYWDAGQITGKMWDQILKTGELAWDVYLIYSPSIMWDKQLPMPAFWMHQLRGVGHAPRLDQTIFEAKVKEVLGSK